jgi:hypothetical protein
MTTATPVPNGWNTVASPRVGAEGKLAAVAAHAATDAWAVGQYEGIDSLQRTLTEHWDGSQWSVVASPSSGAAFNMLLGVSTDAPNDAWAVGYQEAAGANGTNQPLIEHWNGSAWSLSSSVPAGEGGGQLDGVTAISPSDVWAVGYMTLHDTNHQFSGESPLIEHWNGTVWAVVSGAAIPAPAGGYSPFNTLSAVAALASNNVWAVGQDNAPASSGNSSGLTQALVEHWDGSHWKLVPAANPNPNGNGLSGIAVISPNDIWADGSGAPSGRQGCGGVQGSLIEHWDGMHWTSIPFPSPSQPPGIQYLEYGLASVAAVATNDVWVVGGVLSYYSGKSAAFSAVIEHWDGKAWSIVSGPGNGTVAGLTGIAALGSGTVWAVGQFEAANGPSATDVEEYTGGQWAVVDSPSPGTLSNELKGVAAISPTDIWAVGDSSGGTLTEHWNGGAWGYYPSPNGFLADDTLNGVAASSSNDVWAVGTAPFSGSTNADLIEHWNGSQWSIVPGTTTSEANGAELNAVAARSASDVWAVGGSSGNPVGPFAEHWNGSQWSRVATAPASNPGDTTMLSDDSLLGVAAVSASDVWAVGGNPPHNCGGLLPALIEHWNGGQWSIVPNTPQGVLYSVSADSANDVWAVGMGGSGAFVMHYDGTVWSVVPVPVVSKPQSPLLFGVAAHAANDVWAVGSVNTQSGQSASILHWNGTTWSQVIANGPGLAANVLNCVAVVGPHNIWAAGYYGDIYTYGTDSAQALIEHYTG